ncbi:MAG: four helix bundle protein [Ignavibacteriae bacterium]|nr:four helix bundle protein [Ignavibacteriota bacterium]
MMEKRILERSFEFALRVIKLAERFPNSIAGWVVGKQVVRSGTSVGANVEEAQAGYTKDDFTYKMNTALKESRESNYWLRLAKAAGLIRADMIDEMIEESEQLSRILGAIVSTARKESR